jgi:hypothetical protein
MRTGLEEIKVTAFGYKLGHTDGALVQYFPFCCTPSENYLARKN